MWGSGAAYHGLARTFNFAGSLGTGETICAEAIAHSLGDYQFLGGFEL